MTTGTVIARRLRVTLLCVGFLCLGVAQIALTVGAHRYVSGLSITFAFIFWTASGIVAALSRPTSNGSGEF